MSSPLCRLMPLLPVLLAGCGGGGGRPDHIWGKKGVRDGDIVRPRACVLDRQDRLWVVDFTARVQAYDLDGKHLGLSWSTPDYRKGRPSGLGLGRDGRLIVCDSHYGCLRVYDDAGTERRVLRGDFAYISDVVQDADGFYYISEFGECQRVSKLDSDGKLVGRWGAEGGEPGQFARPRALALGPDGLLYVADSCNHRVQVFDRDGRLIRYWGAAGDGPGELRYPYDLAFGPDGRLYVAEFGNHRVQKFTPEGESLGTWGGPGREPGKLHCPWGLAVDRKGRVHVLDTENHRVQRFGL
ncbi:MAG: NHL repeat-containing protein [Gemmataceae bacterium]